MFEIELRAAVPGVGTAAQRVTLHTEPAEHNWWDSVVERVSGVNVGPFVDKLVPENLEPISDAVAETILKQSGKLVGYYVRGGGVYISRAVTVEDCIFECRKDSLYGIRFLTGGSMVARASIFDGKGVPNLTNTFDASLGAPSSAIGQGVYELYECEVRNTTDGIKGPRVVENCLIHKLVRGVGSSGGTSHNDCIQYVGGVTETGPVRIVGNTLRPRNVDTGTLGNAALMFSIKRGSMEGVEIAYNLMDGGNNTIQGGGAAVKGTVHHNVYVPTARYGIATAMGGLEFDRATNIWQSAPGYPPVPVMQ